MAKGRVQAGKLDQRVALQKRGPGAVGGLGDEVQQWTTYATVWAQKTDVSDGERFRAAQVSAEISTRWIIRRSAQTEAASAEHRMVHRGKVHEIVGVKDADLGRNAALEISTVTRGEVADPDAQA